MSENVKRLLERLQAAQHDLIQSAANIDVAPSDNVVRKIADLEVAIGAVEHLLDEGQA